MSYACLDNDDIVYLETVNLCLEQENIDLISDEKGCKLALNCLFASEKFYKYMDDNDSNFEPSYPLAANEAVFTQIKKLLATMVSDISTLENIKNSAAKLYLEDVINNILPDYYTNIVNATDVTLLASKVSVDEVKLTYDLLLVFLNSL